MRQVIATLGYQINMSNIKRREALTKYKVSEPELIVLSGTGMGYYMPPEKLASYLVVLNYSPKENCTTADQLLLTIHKLIRTGYLQIVTKHLLETELIFPKNVSYPDELFIRPSIGAVYFTRKGFLLYRTILKYIIGLAAIRQSDSFYKIDEKNKIIGYYAQTKKLCQSWTANLSKITAHENIESIINGCATIKEISAPTKISGFMPSYFLRVNNGYLVEVKYKKHRSINFSIPESKLEAQVLKKMPVSISGSIDGNHFFFGEQISWSCSAWPKRDDSAAHYTWSFHVYDSHETITPTEANLSNEPPYKGGWLKPNYKFKKHETPKHSRKKPLSINDAKEILASCAISYGQEI